MNRNLRELDVAVMPLQKDVVSAAKASPTKPPAPGELGQHLDQTAILLDIDGTLLDLAPTPREVWVPPGLAKTLTRLLVRTSDRKSTRLNSSHAITSRMPSSA